MNRPNIVFFFSDQQRWDTLGCYGQKLDVTPTLDALAKEGVLFRNAMTCQPVCGPARACLQTGKYATEVGCFTNGRSLPTDIPTLAGRFNEAGYQTAYVGKWHLASDLTENHYETIAIPPERRGGYRDYWMAADVVEFTSHGYNGYLFDKDDNKHEFIGYRTDCITNYAVDFLHNASRDRPFFLMLSHIEPHHQNDHARFEGPDGSKERFRDYEVPGDLVGAGGDWREGYPDYLGACRALDDNVGKIVRTLKSEGLWDNTILLYASDHGNHFCTRNAEYKRSCHEGCIHVPLIVTGGACPKGREVSEIVSLIDLPPTFLDMADIPVPKDYRGKSLRPLVEGRENNWRNEAFLQISESQVGRALRTERWKYSVRGDEKGWEVPRSDVYYEEYLYDLQNDPHERDNLVRAAGYDDVRAYLKERLIARIVESGEPAPKILPAKEA